MLLYFPSAVYLYFFNEVQDEKVVTGVLISETNTVNHHYWLQLDTISKPQVITSQC